jgi:hypothetical protein
MSRNGSKRHSAKTAPQFGLAIENRIALALYVFLFVAFASRYPYSFQITLERSKIELWSSCTIGEIGDKKVRTFG